MICETNGIGNRAWLRSWSRQTAARAGWCAAVALLAAGCVSTSVKRVQAVPALHAEQQVPPAELVNVNIAVFDPGLPEEPVPADEREAFPAVRKAEARFMAVNLRHTLENTGFWGAVRVVPEPIPSSELLVTGEILQSNGLKLAVAVTARDASGRVWLDKTYEAEAAAMSYRGQSDPFAPVYNRIANDLLAARRELATAQLLQVRRLSKLRFAADLAPAAFAPYLAHEDGAWRLTGLPAENDPFMQRVESLRQRDYALIDALDAHYRVFHQQIEPAYDDWRAASYREAENLNELQRQAWTRKILGALVVIGGIVGATQAETYGGATASQVAILGGAVLFGSGMQKSQQSEIHAAALEELGRSLAADLEPRTITLANQTVTLSGSAEAQYEEWRRLLREIYAAETGLVAAPEDDPAPSAPPQADL